MEWLVAEFFAGLVRVGGAIVMAYGIYRYALARRRAWLLLAPVGMGLALLGDAAAGWLLGV